MELRTLGYSVLAAKVSFRGYSDEDYDAVCDFLIELNQKDSSGRVMIMGMTGKHFPMQKL